jgi:hypothetical protein
VEVKLEQRGHPDKVLLAVMELLTLQFQVAVAVAVLALLVVMALLALVVMAERVHQIL